MVLEIDWAIRNCTGNGQEDAFDFNSNDADGAWWEGTARMIVAASLARTRGASALLRSRPRVFWAISWTWFFGIS